MAQENMDQSAVGTSKFYMLRCLVAMAHADGVVCDQESAYVTSLISRLPFTDEQRETLEHDLHSPQSIGGLLPYINEPKYRGQLPYFARLMAYKDGDLHPSEDALLEKLHASAVEGLDMDAIRAEAKKAAEAELLIHDISIDENRPQKGGHAIPWFQWLDELLQSVGIDMMKS